jgi:TonB family protein
LDLPYYREYELAWTRNSEEERSFRRLLSIVFASILFLGAVWPWIPMPAIDPYQVDEIPSRIAKLMLERELPPPPPPKPQEAEPEPEPVAEAKPEAEQVVEAAPEPEVDLPPPPVDVQEVARERAQAALLPFTEDLAALADSDILEKVTDDRPLTASVGEAARNERSMITSQAGAAAASGGINTASLSRNTGGAGLGSRATTTVESPVAAVEQSAGGARRTGDSNRASRSREEIELVFDKNKGAIFALYNRALRMDPTLQGKLVLRLTIAASGEVTFCEVVSSELNDAELERKLVQRVKLFRFEARDVEPVTTTKPIDFFPA